MRGEPFTACKLRLDPGAGEDGTVTRDDEGGFLVTEAGSAYRVDRVRGRTLHCTRWPLAEVPPDALIYRWTWTPRPRRR